jgi:hypothetical protein
MILIAGKTMLDLSLHLHERIRNDDADRQQSPILPDVITGRAAESLPTPPTAAPSHPPVRSSSGD